MVWWNPGTWFSKPSTPAPTPAPAPISKPSTPAPISSPTNSTAPSSSGGSSSSPFNSGSSNQNPFTNQGATGGSSSGGSYNTNTGTYTAPNGVKSSMAAAPVGATIKNANPITFSVNTAKGGQVNSTVDYMPGDLLAVNATGSVNAYASGSKIPGGNTWINLQGQQLYGAMGDSGRTKEQIYNDTQAKLKNDNIFNKGMNWISTGFTFNDPLKLNTAFQYVKYGATSAYDFATGKSNAPAKADLDTQIKSIYENTYTSIYSNSGQGYKGVVSWTAQSPVTITAVTFGVGGLVGAGGAALGEAVTTVPAIATRVLPMAVAGAGFLTANTGIITNVGSQAVAYGVETHYSTVFSNIDQQGGNWATKASTVAYDVVNIGVFGYGVSKGAEIGLPVTYRGVQVEGTTVSQGFYNGWTGKPIYTSTASAINDAGGLEFTKGWGMPNKVAYPSIAEAYTPSGKVETAIFRQYVNSNNIPGVNVEAAYQTTSFTYGAKANVYNKEYLNTFFQDTGFKPQTSTALGDYFKGQKNYEIYGSTPTTAQVQGYRIAKDLDVVFNNAAGSSKATEIAGIINKYEGAGSASTQEGQILFRGTKKFDIHGTDNPAQFSIVNKPFGFNKLAPVDIGGYPTSRLSQEGVNKLASVGSLQPEGFVSPNMVKRGKDIADFYVIQKELIQVKGGSGSITAAVYNTAYREGAIQTFGENALTENYPKLLAFNSGSSASRSFSLASMASSVSTTALISSSFGSGSSRSSSNSMSLSFAKVSSLASSSSPGSFSFSSSPSPSRSPSISYSPSGSGSPSPYSPSPSPSPSFRFSISPSPSRSPSPSPSPSPYITTSPYYFPPFNLGGGGDNGFSNVIKGGKRKTGYIPSFSALLFKKFGSYKSGKLAKTGLDYRPITKSFKISKGGFKIRI